MRVDVLSPETWLDFAPHAHLICFGEVRDPNLDRIDFALLASHDEKPVTYITCKELDAESIYVQYGGAFPDSRGTAKSFAGWMSMLKFLKDKGYKRGGMYVENTNKVMLKFALKSSWLITGMRTFENAVLIEHQLKFENLEV